MNKIWNAILIDDSPSDLEFLKKLLQKYSPHVNVLASVSEYKQVRALIHQLKINVIFCSCRIGSETALEMLDQLGPFVGHVIFQCEDETFAVRAIGHNALGYLLKPVSVASLLEVIVRLEFRPLAVYPENISLCKPEQVHKATTQIMTAGGVQHIVQVVDIIHLHGDGNYTTVYFNSGEAIMISKSLKHFDDVLPEKTFFRVHQSHIVNINNVRSVQSNDQVIKLSNGNLVPLSRRKKDQFMGWLVQTY